VAARPLERAAGELGPAFQKPVTLEFRDAPLRQVFEALARSSSGVNFVFDKDVRSTPASPSSCAM
jgi:general secretion pathway protein D